MQQTRTAGGQDTSGHAAPVARRRVWHGQLARRPKAAETHVATLQACSHRAAPQPAPDAAGPCPARARTLCSQDRSRSAVCRATATSTASVTSDDVAGTGAASVNGSGQSQLPVSIPQHWEQQMKSAPLGKRRVLQRYCEVLEQINSLEPRMQALTETELKAKTGEFKARLASGAGLDSLLPEAFAVVREVSRRVLGMRHFDSQMVGGMVLHAGAVAEMSTGEGKTLVATLPAYLNALTGRRVHVVTVNDYLATRDAEWMGKVYSYLGLTCSAVRSSMTLPEYKVAYSSDITYVTGQELGFAYLRDNTAASAQDLVLPADLHYAIIDEADSILIDESRNPLIISLPITENEYAVLLVDKLVRPMYEEVSAICQQSEFMIRQSYWQAWGDRMSENVRQLMERDIKEAADKIKGKYYKVDQKARNVTMTPLAIQTLLAGLEREGVVFQAAVLERRPPNTTDVFEDPNRYGQLAITAFKAYELYQLGKQYIVRDDKVVLIDENTGRLRDITRWQDGLHQAVEAKERVPIKQETLPTASITFQVFFKAYSKLAGMTGTAAPAAAEFFELYKLKVVQVPTNKPKRRVDLSSRFYFDPDQRTAELCRIVENCWMRGRPVLIGTTSVQQSEAVLQALVKGTSRQAFAEQQGAVQVLNAKPEKVRLESQVVAQAGLPGAVTIATNMAGRGTDIILGGSAEGLTKLILTRLIYRQLMKAEEAGTIPCLPYLLRAGPLGVYDAAASVTAAMDELRAGPQKGLPFETIMGAMLLAAAEVQMQSGTTSSSSSSSLDDAGSRAGGRQPPGTLTYDQARGLVSWVVDTAGVLVREGYERLRSKFEGISPNDLEYSVCIAPVLSDVLRDREDLYRSQPQGQQFALKAAVMLRAWLDRQCAAWGEAVRREGGLLVIGMSLQESRRVELQLRGRAGRQGDPGTTIMMYDIYDPYIAVQNSTGVFEMVRQMDQSSGASFKFVDGPLVDTLVSTTQRSVESMFSNARLEMKRYDEVLDDYRQSVYRLRRLILLGSSQQCTQVLYMFIQSWVDELVSTYLGSGETAPSTWLNATVAVSSLPPELQAGVGAMGVPGVEVGATVPTHVSPWQVVMRAIETLVNPEGRVGRTSWEFELSKDGIAQDQTMRNVLGKMGMLSTQPGATGGPSILSLSLDLESLSVLSSQQMQDLACFITGASSPTTAQHAQHAQHAQQAGADSLSTQHTVSVSSSTNGIIPLSYTSQQQDTVGSHTSNVTHSHGALTTTDQKRRGGWFGWLTGVPKGSSKGISHGGHSTGLGLAWPQPPMRLTAKQQLSVMTHARLFGMRFAWSDESLGTTDVSSGGGAGHSTRSTRNGGAQHAQHAQQAGTDAALFEAVTGLPASSALTIAQRPALKGRYADQLLRNYLGLVLIHAFEQRRVAACKALQARGAAALDMDAQDQMWAYEREVMLNWLDAVWSVFLQEVEALKKAVAVKTYGSSNPLAEFQLEVNRTFLGMLTTYREATVAQVMVPNMTINTPLDGPEQV